MGRKRKAEPAKTKRDRHGLRDRLSRAGAELFAERGVHATQVADVARHADSSIGAFYRYFRDKDELYRELVERRFAEYAAALDGLVQAFTSSSIAGRVEVMRSVVRRLLAMHLEDPVTFRLWHRNAHADPAVDKFARDMEQMLVAILDRTIAVGGFLDEATRHLVATSMVGMVNTVAERMIATDETDLDRATEVLTRIAAGGMLALAPPEFQATLLAMYQKEIAS